MKKQEVLNLIKLGENEFVEFKRNFSSQVIESLVAFSNFKGGRVIIGVNDKGRIFGVELHKESIQNWINEIKTKTSQNIIPKIIEIDISGKKIIIFEVLEFPIKPIDIKGRYFIRKNNSNHILTPMEISQCFNDSSNSSFDSFIIKAKSIEDLDFDEVRIVIDLINTKRDKKVVFDEVEFLKKYGLIKSKSKITLAALLLFGKEYGFKRKIQIGVFQSTLIIKDELVNEDYLFNQVDEIADFLKKHINFMTFITPRPQNIQK